MPQSVATPVSELVIDLKNFRTIEQPDEVQAVQAMISTDADQFWALMDSMLQDGYLPTENIIVLKSSVGGSNLLVKEGNRRVAALKLIFGFLPTAQFGVPEDLAKKIANVSPQWKTENTQVPCAIYPAKDAAIVDRIVSLTHGKQEQAGRVAWNSVARARHNRDHNKSLEHGLDLLEKYLVNGENLSRQQAKRWAGYYKLTVLDEALGKIAPRFCVKSGPELAKQYPAIANKPVLDDVLRDIGIEIITFATLRSPTDFLASYFPQPAPAGPQANPQGGASPSPDTGNTGGNPTPTPGGASPTPTYTNPAGGQPGGAPAPAPAPPEKKVIAVPIGDPRIVKRTLTKFSPLGPNRQKVVTLRDEAKRLKLKDNPIAFCFLLRSMFEISAKAYCVDYKASGGPSLKKSNGEDKTLAVALKEITSHLTKNNQDPAMVKVLHGAMTELARSDGLLSVTSMNQLVHNPTFSVTATDIATLFGNVFPLLEAMNS